MKKGLFSLVGSFLIVYSYAQNDSAIGIVEDTAVAVVQSGNSASIPKYQVVSDEVYQLKPALDIPLTIVAAGTTLYGFSQIYNKEGSSEQTIRNLRKEDVNGFDRWAAGMYSEKAADASDMIFYGSMPLPLLLMFDKEIRKDAPKVGLLFLEAMSITGVLYTSTNYLANRYRPFTYGDEAPIGKRTGGGAKNSFIAGHPALVATSTFFMAKVYSDYHPESKVKWLFYTAAGVATGATAYLRHRAGMHFPSDLIAGVTVGTLSGILVPHFHKNKIIKNDNLSITPFTGSSHGLALTYRFK